jgi:type VI secretion system ImpB/VipA family protein
MGKIAAVRKQKQRDKPRVHPMFLVEEEGQSPEFELAFDVAVVAPLYGDRRDPERLDKRDFVQINSRNFDDSMRRMKPRLDLEIEVNGKRQLLSIEFNQMTDFDPEAILQQLVKQVPEAAKLKEVRDSLLAIKNEGGVNSELRRGLEDALADASVLDNLLKSQKS